MEERTPVKMGGRGVDLKTMEDLYRFSRYVAASGLAPKGMEKAESCFVAIHMGLEVGMSPMQALQNIAPINGRPAIWGDSCLALVRASGELESYKEDYVGKLGTDDFGCRVTVKRKGFPESSELFTIGDAKRAGLWGKQGPWSQYPNRMLKFRARGFILRDQFGDVLKGLRSIEEIRDETEDPETRFANAKPVGGSVEKEPYTRADNQSEEWHPLRDDILKTLEPNGVSEAEFVGHLREIGQLDEGVRDLDEACQFFGERMEAMKSTMPTILDAIIAEREANEPPVKGKGSK